MKLAFGKFQVVFAASGELQVTFAFGELQVTFLALGTVFQLSLCL